MIVKTSNPLNKKPTYQVGVDAGDKPRFQCYVCEKMKNSYLNYSIDMMILITGLLCGITGIIKWPGLVYALGLSYQGLPLDAITSIHDWTGLLMILFAVLHVIMHLKWLVTMTKKIMQVKVVKNEKT